MASGASLRNQWEASSLVLYRMTLVPFLAWFAEWTFRQNFLLEEGEMLWQVSFEIGMGGRGRGDEHIAASSVVERDDVPTRAFVERTFVNACGCLGPVFEVGSSFISN
jgi:hypothetical protein